MIQICLGSDRTKSYYTALKRMVVFLTAVRWSQRIDALTTTDIKISDILLHILKALSFLSYFSSVSSAACMYAQLSEAPTTSSQSGWGLYSGPLQHLDTFLLDTWCCAWDLCPVDPVPTFSFGTDGLTSDSRRPVAYTTLLTAGMRCAAVHDGLTSPLWSLSKGHCCRSLVVCSDAAFQA